MQRIYLDHAATTPIDDAVIACMTQLMREDYGNPSSIHHHGRRARIAIEDARKVVAKTLNVSTGEIFFTSSATEANNAILNGAVHGLDVTRIITSPIEHPCVLNTIIGLAERNDIELHYLAVDSCGNVDLDQMAQLLSNASDGKTLVSLMHINNELGVILDIDRVAALCEEHGALFHSDTVQSISKYHLDFQETKVGFACGSAHKFNGPKGVGFMYINADNMIPAQLFGGGQERNMRAGTENIYGIVGLAKALSIATDQQQQRSDDIESLRNSFIKTLNPKDLGIKILGNESYDRQNPAILNLSFPKTKMTELMMMNLDIAGISSSSGSACSSGAMNQSHVLSAIGADPERVSVRFSFSHLNTEDEIQHTCQVLQKMMTE